MNNSKLLFFSTLFTVSTVNAQVIIDPQLIEPIKNAINTSYEIQNKALEIEKNKYQIDEVNGKLKPNVSALALGTYYYANGSIDLPTKSIEILNLNLFEGSKNFTAQGGLATLGVTASQVIFSGLQVPNAIKAIEEKNLAFENLKDAQKEQIAKDVVSTFDQIMLLAKVEELIQNSAKRLDKEHQKVQKAIQNGLAIPYDREKIKLAMLELESKQVEIRGNRQLLYDKLKVITHLPQEQLENIHYNLTPIDVLTSELDLSNKKEIKALEHSIKAYEFLYEKEKGAHLPQVFAFAGANFASAFGNKFTLKDVDYLGDVRLGVKNLSMFPAAFVGIGAKWELLDGGQHKNKLYQAKSDILINQNKLKDSEEKLNLLLSKTKVEYETASEKLKVNQQQNTVATNNLDIASKRFQEGLIDVTERLAAENDYYKANLGYYNQIVDQRLKTFEVLNASGELLNKIYN